MEIGFIGLGNMGGPMAANLLKAGHSLTVFDLSEKALQAAVDAGARTAASPREVAQTSEVVITMLPAAAHVKAVYLNADGVLAGVLFLLTLLRFEANLLLSSFRSEL